MHCFCLNSECPCFMLFPDDASSSLYSQKSSMICSLVSYLIITSAKMGQSVEVFVLPHYMFVGTEIVVPFTFLWELV